MDLYRRLKYYFSKVNLARSNKSKINNALLHYGYSAFSLTILEFIDITSLPESNIKNFVIEREQYYIDLLKPEYNILKTAGSLLGFKHSEDTIIKFKKAKSNDSNPMFSKNHSVETKLKMSDLKFGKLRSEETKSKISLTKSRKVSIYEIDTLSNKKIKIKDFDSYSETAKFLNCSIRTLSRYVDKNILYKKKMIFIF